jgi:hypothetical protein
MSYNNHRNKAMDSNESLGRRKLAINACVEHLSFTLRGFFRNQKITYTNLWACLLKNTELIHDQLPKPIPEEDLVKIVKELDRARSLFLSYQNDWETYRQRSRSNQASKKELEYLAHLEERYIQEMAI